MLIHPLQNGNGSGNKDNGNGNSFGNVSLDPSISIPIVRISHIFFADPLLTDSGSRRQSGKLDV